MQNRNELMRVPAVLELLDKSRPWLYTQIRSDPSFPRPVRIGNRISFRRSELMAWIDSLPRAEPDGIDVVTKRKLAAEQRAA